MRNPRETQYRNGFEEWLPLSKSSPHKPFLFEGSSNEKVSLTSSEHCDANCALIRAMPCARTTAGKIAVDVHVVRHNIS